MSRRIRSWNLRPGHPLATLLLMGAKLQARRVAKRGLDRHHMIDTIGTPTTTNISRISHGRVPHGMTTPTRGTHGQKKMDIALQIGRAPTVARDSTGPQHRWLLRDPTMASPTTDHPSRGEGCHPHNPPRLVGWFYWVASKVSELHLWLFKQWRANRFCMSPGNATQSASSFWRSISLMQFIVGISWKMMQPRWLSWC